MLCPHCNVKLPRNAKYCFRCGYLLFSDDVLNYGDTLEYKLIGIYLPDNKISFNLHNISLGYLLFNFSYAFYKKQYYIGVISFFSSLYFFKLFLRGFGAIFQGLGFFALFYIFSFMLCAFIILYYVFKFNELYLANVKYRVNKIIKNHPSEDYESLSVICKKDSRNCLLLALLSIFLFLFFAF